jgi:hypothetical protein
MSYLPTSPVCPEGVAKAIIECNSTPKKEQAKIRKIWVKAANNAALDALKERNKVHWCAI